MVALHQLTDVWTGGATFQGISLNVTDTSSTMGSLLMDLQKDGVSRFKVRKDGTVSVGISGAGGMIYPNTDAIDFYNYGGTQFHPIRARSVLTSWASARTTDVSAIHISEGWDNAAVDFTALKISLTDTASGPSAKLMNFLVGGVSRFSVSKDGAVTAPNVLEKLAADRTYYVRTDGNDANNGLADTSGGAFATIQKAFDHLADRIDINGKVITIQLQTGVTHAGGNAGGRFITGRGPIFISGSAVNNTDTIISGTSDNGLSLGGNPMITWYIGGVKLQSSYYIPLYIRNVPVQLGSPDGLVPAPRFGAPGTSFAALIQLDGPLASCVTYSAGTTIDVGGAPTGYFVQAMKGAIFSSGPVAFAATTTFNNAFVEAIDNATVTVNTVDAVAGSAVGKRYNVTTGGQVKRTAGTGGINNIPGTVAGTWTGPVFSSLSVNGTLSMGTGQLLSWGSAYMWGATGSPVVHVSQLAVDGAVVWTPPASITLANNGELTVEATSNTTVTIKLRGNDGVTRSTTLTLT